jgi:type IV fimbrial biogenesis protein FimT
MIFPNRGFTLVELMVTVAVAAIVIGIAIPSFNSMITNNRSVTIANEFADVLSFARTQAVSRSARISICASNTGTSCVGDWEDGYIVFIDTTITDTAPAPEVGEVLKYSQKPKGNVEFTVGYGDDGATPASFFRYTSAGTLARLSNEALEINSKIIGCTGDYARVISITLAGQAIIQPKACGT